MELQKPVLTLATDIVLAVHNIIVDHEVVALNLQLQKELDLVRECLIKGEDVEVPFTPYLTKKQRKQLSKLNSYNTRSKGAPKGG